MIYIFGSNGMLGTYLNKFIRQYESDVKPLTRKDIDLTLDQSRIKTYLLNLNKNDIIINASGVIKQREYNQKDMILVNSIFPHILSEIKSEIGCEVIHITTDCVFSGKNAYMKENDIHDPLDDYGKSKSLGEPDNLTIIRTSIIGEEILNKRSLLEWVISNKGKEIDGYTNHLWNGLTCLELSSFIYEIINSESYWQGVRHVFSNTVSKYELVLMISEIYKLDITVNSIHTTEHCHRNLDSLWTDKNSRIEKSLYQQIEELKEFKIKI